MNEQELNAKLFRIKEDQKNLQIPSAEIANHLEYLKIKSNEQPRFIPCGCMSSEKFTIQSTFQRAFQSLTKSERIEYYQKNVEIMKEILDKKEMSEEYEEGPSNMTMFFFNEEEKVWETKAVTIDRNAKTITWKSTKHELDMHNYILRASKKKDKSSLVLESTTYLQQPETLRVSNYKGELSDIKKLLDWMIN